ncbi:hypothetical protein BCR35DRAFT_301118 [Leucosporidium creatinivorum]|uniref:NAD(P)-binding protein n=1 Tax=Leucosporidium creatinivorum TaxID=106004 RepID=A0A1Y2FXN8_9BASI|nr:hypothetical protein BCR35DRAFT_301118 [Leucosporidium creatinivorum]
MASWLSRNTGYPLFSRKWEPDTGIPDLSGKVAIVTGGNTGIGYQTVLHLLKHGAKVYIACRSEERARGAIEKLNKELPDSASKLVYLPFDLTDLGSAQRAVETFLAKEERLDIVIANAAVMAWPYKIVNGVEVQFWNHLGHFALIKPLLPLLIKTSKEPNSHVRIVNVSSMGHRYTPKPDFTSLETVNAPLGSTWDRYGQSKLANVLFTAALQKQLAAENIRCLSVHPGLVHSELTRGVIQGSRLFGSLIRWGSSLLAMSTFEGAKTQLYAATSPEVDEKDLKAAFLWPIATVETPSAFGRDETLADELWSFSERAVKELSARNA